MPNGQHDKRDNRLDSEPGADVLAGAAQRDKGIIRTSIVGIIANLLLAGFKAAVGLLSNSIAIVLDAVNNTSDALSSIITIVGTKLANKPADRNHPYGHGRTEYITTIVIAAIIIGAGITALQESVERILNPQTANYNAVTLIVVAVAVIAKIALGLFTKKRGQIFRSDLLVASGTDALMDAIISASTLVAALIFLFSGISLEAWLGAIIALIIIKAGVDILREAISHILGERADSAVSTGIKRTVESVEGVLGAYDLVLHDFGPDRMSGSIHVEVDENMSARDIDVLTRTVQAAVMREHGILLHTVGIYSSNASTEGDVGDIRSALLKLANDNVYILQVHGFYVDESAKQARFDIIISWDAPNRRGIYDDVLARLREKFPEYTFNAILDSDISD